MPMKSNGEAVLDTQISGAVLVLAEILSPIVE